MRALLQRVKEAKVYVKEKEIAKISKGILVFLGIKSEDTTKDVDYLVSKILNLRIFEDNEGKFNYSILEVGGEILIVSQFTLYGDCRRGRRPDFKKAAIKEKAEELYLEFIEKIKNNSGLRVESGIFQAKMLVEIHNQGPVTFLIESL
jgi:D-tyrosyl-tRNA(Tyr) deacylase